MVVLETISSEDKFAIHKVKPSDFQCVFVYFKKNVPSLWLGENCNAHAELINEVMIAFLKGRFVKNFSLIYKECLKEGEIIQSH